MISKVGVGIRLHIDKVDDTIDVFFEPNWQVNRQGILAKTAMDRLERLVEITTDLVDLVDEADAWHTILVCLTPDSFRLRFHAHFAIKHRHRAV